MAIFYYDTYNTLLELLWKNAYDLFNVSVYKNFFNKQRKLLILKS